MFRYSAVLVFYNIWNFLTLLETAQNVMFNKDFFTLILSQIVIFEVNYSLIVNEGNATKHIFLNDINHIYKYFSYINLRKKNNSRKNKVFITI